MEIRNRQDLAKAAEEAGALLQQIHDYCSANNLNWAKCEEAKVRFPRGFIRTADVQRARLPFIEDRHLKSNLAYTLILSDVVLWLRVRTDLWGTPREMLVKLYVFLLGTLCESITKDYLKGICGKHFKARNVYLKDAGIITKELSEDLDWLWDIRNNMHLFQLDQGEFRNDYNEECHAKSVSAFRGLIASLRAKGPLNGG